MHACMHAQLLAELLGAMEHKLRFASLGLSKVVHPYPSYSWALSMLATDVNRERFQSSTAGKVVQWIVRQG